MTAIILAFRLILPMMVTQNSPERTLLQMRHPLRLLFSVLGVIANPIFRLVRGWQVAEEPAADAPEAEASAEQGGDASEEAPGGDADGDASPDESA